MLEVSLVIPAHNEEHRLQGTLAAYGSEMDGKYGENFEIVVVANGCSDATVGVASGASGATGYLPSSEVASFVFGGKGEEALIGWKPTTN
jgi:hypothetical protein